MEVILLATEAQRAILADEVPGAASIATLMDRINWSNAGGLSSVI